MLYEIYAHHLEQNRKSLTLCLYIHIDGQSNRYNDLALNKPLLCVYEELHVGCYLSYVYAILRNK